MAKKFSKYVKAAKARAKARSTSRQSKFKAMRKIATRPQRSIVTMGKGFPKKMEFTHTYDELVKLTSSVGVANVYRVSCNGIFDPNITGTGHQPLYFDQLTALYDHYVVIGSKIEYTIIPDVSAVAFKLGCFVNDDTTSASFLPEALAEQPTGKFALCAHDPTKPIKRTLKWSAKKNFGKGVLANTELQGTASANPTEQSYFELTMQPADATTTMSVFVNFKVTYIVIWKELKDVAQS